MISCTLRNFRGVNASQKTQRRRKKLGQDTKQSSCTCQEDQTTNKQEEGEAEGQSEREEKQTKKIKKTQQLLLEVVAPSFLENKRAHSVLAVLLCCSFRQFPHLPSPSVPDTNLRVSLTQRTDDQLGPTTSQTLSDFVLLPLSCKPPRMAIVYALVARGNTVLCEYTDTKGNFPTVTQSILDRIPHQTNDRRSFVYDK